jgi:cytochrome c1
MTRIFSAKAVALAVAAALVGGSAALAAGGDAPHIERQKWSFAGPLGYFDNAQLQRGFLVYKEVCAACHGLKRLSFRNLSEKGGPEFPEEGVKGLAAEWPNQIFDGPNEQGRIADSRGNIIKRPARLSDRILGPYDNENAARAAQNGALPPDLSIITLARGLEVDKPFWRLPDTMLRDILTGYQEAGADYLYALLTGYAEAPAYRQDGAKLVSVPVSQARGNRAILRCSDVTQGKDGKPDECNKIGEGLHYNTAFSGKQIAMAAPLSDGVPKYTDGSPQTVSQYAKDVTAFLAWAADPHMEQRKRMGVMAMIYLLITAVLLYFAKKRIWSRAH